MTKKELEIVWQAVYMGWQWANSLIDADVPNGKADMKTARKAARIVKKELKKLESDKQK